MSKMEIELGQLVIHLERNRSPLHIIHKNKLRMYLKNLSIYLKKTSGKHMTIVTVKKAKTDWVK